MDVARFPRSVRRAQGFTLIEVLVALTLLAVGAAVAFDWLQQSARTLRTFGEREAQARLKLNVQAMAAAIDLAKTPTGERQEGKLRMRWTSTVQQPPSAPVVAEADPRYQWQVGLAVMDVVASQVDQPLREVRLQMLQPILVPPIQQGDAKR